MEKSPNEATTEDPNENEGNSEFRTTCSDESPLVATQSDIEAQGPSTTEKTQANFSTRKQSKTTDIRLLTAIIQLNRRHGLMYKPLQFVQYKKQALLDTGASQNAMSETKLRNNLTTHLMALIQEMPAPDLKVQIAKSNIIPVRKQDLRQFSIADKQFKESSWISRRWETS